MKALPAPKLKIKNNKHCTRYFFQILKIEFSEKVVRNIVKKCIIRETKGEFVAIKFRLRIIWGKLFGGTVPPNNTLFGGTPDFEKPFLMSMKSCFG